MLMGNQIAVKAHNTSKSHGMKIQLSSKNVTQIIKIINTVRNKTGILKFIFDPGDTSWWKGSPGAYSRIIQSSLKLSLKCVENRDADNMFQNMMAA